MGFGLRLSQGSNTRGSGFPFEMPWFFVFCRILCPRVSLSRTGIALQHSLLPRGVRFCRAKTAPLLDVSDGESFLNPSLADPHGHPISKFRRLYPPNTSGSCSRPLRLAQDLPVLLQQPLAISVSSLALSLVHSPHSSQRDSLKTQI